MKFNPKTSTLTLTTNQPSTFFILLNQPINFECWTNIQKINLPCFSEAMDYLSFLDDVGYFTNHNNTAELYYTKPEMLLFTTNHSGITHQTSIMQDPNFIKHHLI